MSNHLAIATVTAALAQIVQASAQKEESSASVEIDCPTAPTGGSPANKIYVYLYQVTPSAALRNSDLPARDSDGKLTQRPRVALDLHYLLAFYGNPAQLSAHRMLGAVERDLHARPVLTRQAIQDAIAGHSVLAGSDLANSAEWVKFSPAPLSLDDLSKLWSVFFQTKHALSVVYVASVVLIDAEEGAEPAPPVLYRGQDDRGVDTLLGPLPLLQAIHVGDPSVVPSPPGPRLPPGYPSAQMGSRLTLTGSSLAGGTVRVCFNHPLLIDTTEPPPPPDQRIFPQRLAPLSASAGYVQVDLPTVDDAHWAAGIYAVTVDITRDGKKRSSGSLPLALAPRILEIMPPNPVARVAGTATLTVKCSPQVLPAQKAELLLGSIEAAAEPRVAATGTLTFIIKNAPAVPGVLARLRVDNVESLRFTLAGAPPQLVPADQPQVTIT